MIYVDSTVNPQELHWFYSYLTCDVDRILTDAFNQAMRMKFILTIIIIHIWVLQMRDGVDGMVWMLHAHTSTRYLRLI